ncbi:MAG: zf-HC2 domain-containing protein [Pseudomonadota bacterium]|nr:zf-HC2 domain-containing protein [Pseudomonadota bacterium]
MPSCEDVGLLISQTHDRELTRGERFRLKLHTAMCRGCSRFQRHLHVLRQAIQEDKR